MPKSFFNEYEAFNQEANDLCNEIGNIISPIIHKYYMNGFPLREIGTVIHSEISLIISEKILRYAMQKVKEERGKNERLFNYRQLSLV